MADPSVVLSADTTALKSGMADAASSVQKSLGSMSASAKQLATDVGVVDSALKGYSPSLMSALNSTDQLSNSAKSAAASNKSLADSLKEVEASSGSANALVGPMEEAGKAADGARTMTAGFTRELIVLGHEGISGNLSRIPGSLMVLAERMGGLQSISLSVLGPLAAAGIAIYELGKYAYTAYEEVQKLQGAMNLVGHGTDADFSAAKANIDAMRGNLGASRAEATAAATAIRAIPVSTDSARSAMENYALEASRATNGTLTVAKAADEIARAARGGASGVESLAQAWGLKLEPAQTEALEKAKAANDVIAAQSVLVAALGNRFDPTTKHLEGLTAAWSAMMAIAATAEGAMSAAPEMPSVPKMETGPGLSPDDASISAAQKLADALDPAAKEARDLQTQMDALNVGLKKLGDDADPAIRGQMVTAIDEAQRKIDSIQMGPVMERARAEIAKMQSTWDGSQEGMLARTQAIWSSYVGQVRAGSAQAVEIQTLADRATTDLHKLEASDHLRALQAAVEAAKSGSAERVAAAQAEVTFAVAHYKEGSVQAIEAEKALTIAKREEADARKKDSDKQTADQLLALKAVTQEAKAGSAERVAAAQAEVNFAVAHYQEGSRQAIEAEKDLTIAKQAEADKRVAIETKSISDQIKELDRRLTAGQAHENQLVQQHQISTSQQLAADTNLVNSTYAMELEKADQELALQTKGTTQYQTAMDQRLAIQQKYGTAIERLQDQQAAYAYRSWQSTLAPIGTAVNGMLQGVLQGTQTFGQAMQNVAQNLVLSFISSRIQIEVDWLAGQLAMSLGANEFAEKSLLSWVSTQLGITSASETASTTELATKAAANVAQGALSVASGFSQISVAAAVAAANAFASTAAIPYIGPELAPEAAAVAYGATMGWAAGLGGGLASAAGGYDIPAGVNPLVQAHAQEMILPADLSNRVRNMTDSGGDTHIHIHAVDSQSFTRLLKTNPKAITDAINGARRNGTLKVA